MINKIFFLTALISLTALTATADLLNSNISITPEHPGLCEFYSRTGVNHIFEIEAHENDSLAVVSFKTTYGPCEHAEILQNVRVKVIGDTFYNLFEPYPADASIDISKENPTLGLVKLSFDKKEIFKKSSIATFSYSLVTDRGFEFRWNIKLSQLPDHSTVIQMSRF